MNAEVFARRRLIAKYRTEYSDLLKHEQGKRESLRGFARMPEATARAFGRLRRHHPSEYRRLAGLEIVDEPD